MVVLARPAAVVQAVLPGAGNVRTMGSMAEMASARVRDQLAVRQ
jgi:hypothetical protein